MLNQYVIPDLHGCIETLKYVLSTLLKPVKGDRIFFLGDFVNKGPDSKGVIDLFAGLVESEIDVFAVRGNHDQLFLNARKSVSDYNIFLERGGESTMESFKVNNIESIPGKYFKLLEDLPFYIELEEYILVHAGFDFSSSDPFNDEISMLNIRDFTYSASITRNRAIIHGHNASPFSSIINNLIERKNMIYNIDNGCVYRERADMGNLVILNLKDFSYHIQPNLDACIL